MILEKGAADEVFVLKAFSIQIDIAALIDHINKNPKQYQVFDCETSQLLDINRAEYINSETLSKICEQRVNQPVLIADIKEYMWVIDGNHRLLKRSKLKKLNTSYIPITAEQLDPFVSEFSLR